VVGLLLWARRVRDIDRLLHGQLRISTGLQHGAAAANASSAMLTADVGS